MHIYYEGWSILFLPSEIQPWLLIHLTEKLPQQSWNTSLHSSGPHEAEKQETQTASTLAELKKWQMNITILLGLILYFTLLYAEPFSILNADISLNQ